MSRSDRVCVRQVDVCIHVSTCMYCLYAQTWTYACTMYIYMQVLNGCLAVTEFASCRLTSVYLCSLYAHTWTYNVHRHSLHAGAQSVSHSDRVCVLQVDVCIHVSTCAVCIHTHGVHIHSLHAGGQWVSRS